MKLFSIILLLASLINNVGCTVISVADAVISTAVDVTVGTVKVATKVTTTAIDAVIPDDED